MSFAFPVRPRVPRSPGDQLQLARVFEGRRESRCHFLPAGMRDREDATFGAPFVI
jgi:hypothetical protein